MQQPYYYSSTDVGAPTLNNANGSVLEILRACGINGYNSRSVSSILVASGVATATIATHGYTNKKAQLIRFAGSTEAGLNGDKQPTAVTTNTVVFAAPGVADGTYTGSITAKRAPFGLVEEFTGTNQAIFSRAHPESTGMLLRVNDSGGSGATATDARILMLESATGMDTYGDVGPTEAQVSGGLYLGKGPNSATAKRWVIVASGRFMYFFTPYASDTSILLANAFGDIVSHRESDPYGCLIAAPNFATAGSSSRKTTLLRGNVIATTAFQTNGFYLARVSGGAAGAAKAENTAFSVGPIGSSGDSNPPKVIITGPVFVQEQLTAFTSALRGELPGAAYPVANKPYASEEVVVTDSGETYLSIRFYETAEGNALISLDDWESAL